MATRQRPGHGQVLEEFHNLHVTGDQVNVLYQALWTLVDLYEQGDEESDPVVAAEARRAREIITALDGLR